MEQFQNNELEYVADDGITDFNEVPRPSRSSSVDSDDSDFEDDFELSKPITDTSALEARNGKDIQGINWERINYAREKYRESRVDLFQNYENLSLSRQHLDKEYTQVEKIHTFYDFQFNTRLVKPTIVHFQRLSSLYFVVYHSLGFPPQVCFCQLLININACQESHEFVIKQDVFGVVLLNISPDYQKRSLVVLRNLLWATSKHDVYLMQNYSVMHWSSLLRRGREVLNVAKPISPSLNYIGCEAKTLSRVQVSTMAVKDNLMIAGGFQGELICKYLDQPGVAFCSKVAAGEKSITNAVEIYHNPSGSTRIMAANNDSQVRVMDAVNFACLSRFTFPWCVNNTSVSGDGKLVAVLGDSRECLLADAQSGKVVSTLNGHMDYSFSSAWHPDGRVVATGNQDTTCRLWDIRNTSESFAMLKGRMGAIRAIKFTSDGRFMAMAEPLDFVHIFDTKSGYGSGQEIDLFGEISGISFSPDSEALFVGASDRTFGGILELKRRRHYLDDCFF